MTIRSARPLLLVAVAIGAFAFWMRHRAEPLVIYCAHDSIYAESVLRDFERRTGIPVAIRFDTEATKSLGLVELLIAEKDAPRCDVFWNNELLGTLDLAERGLLQPMPAEACVHLPAQDRDDAARWAGFAARMRVCIYNPDRIPPATAEAEIARRWAGHDLSRAAIARPLYGTTLTHYAVLWNLWGADRLRQWHHDTRAAGLRELNGNAAVKDAVAGGACDFGFTDTDDFFEAKDAGKSVAMLPVRLADGAVICIPNTVAIIRGARHPAQARQLVEYLLSPATELALARSRSRQIPLGPVPDEQLPAEVHELRQWAEKSAPLNDLSRARAECLAWLKAEALR
jgi:iron(III) transport system substrate-binding protein